MRRRQRAAADLDKQIADAQAALADADAALQAASPNYGQLVQQVVPAEDVFWPRCIRMRRSPRSLLGENDGWVFLLRDGTITVAKVDGGAAARWRSWWRGSRAGIELTTDQLPTFDVADAQKLYDDRRWAVAPVRWTA